MSEAKCSVNTAKVLYLPVHLLIASEVFIITCLSKTHVSLWVPEFIHDNTWVIFVIQMLLTGSPI